MLQLRISFIIHTADNKVGILAAVETGPIFTKEETITQPPHVFEICQGFLRKALADLPAIVERTLPSLPENIERHPHHLTVARQWLNLVESGKEGARCLAHETPSGERQIIITLEPKKANDEQR